MVIILISNAGKVTSSKEAFRLSWLDLKHIKLRTTKGAFETCGVCNNLNDVLKDLKKEWSKLEIVLRLKRLHLLQQAQERLDSKKRREEARLTFDADGNPTIAYLEFDGYSNYKTMTPIHSRKSKGDLNRIGNRVIGVIVQCVSIGTRFVYSLNDLIGGGANIMIEVLRQGKRLKKLLVPPVIFCDTVC